MHRRAVTFRAAAKKKRERITRANRRAGTCNTVAE